MKINKICKHCAKEYLADTRYTSRNEGFFCSQSCSSTYNNIRREPLNLNCICCKRAFYSKSKNAMYCSIKCKGIVSRQNGMKYTRSTLSRRINRHLNTGTFVCFTCGWDKTVCDIHHIIPKSKGGTDSYDNLTILCPNCHRLAHTDLTFKHTSITERIGLYHNVTNVLDAVGSP